jgi:hypothetical protein
VIQRLIDWWDSLLRHAAGTGDATVELHEADLDVTPAERPDPARRREQILERARSAIGRPTRYRLGAGGTSPLASHPADGNAECDCTGLSGWTCGHARHLPHHARYQRIMGGWVSTDSILADVRQPLRPGETRLYEQIDAPEPGDLVVYGSLRDAHGQRVRAGHIGIVSAGSGWGEDLRIIHCSATNGRGPDAIAETGPGSMRARGAVFVRYVG